MEPYNKLIFLDEKSKEEFSKLTERQLNFCACLMAETMFKMEKKIEDDLLKQSKP